MTASDTLQQHCDSVQCITTFWLILKWKTFQRNFQIKVIAKHKEASWVNMELFCYF